jgi:hypothetical protein
METRIRFGRGRVGTSVPSTISTVSGPCAFLIGESASNGARWSTTRPAADFEIPNNNATCR